MKKLLLSTLFATLFFVACSKNNPEEIVQPQKVNLLTRSVIEAGTNDSIVQTYTYDVNNRVTIINQTANPSNDARLYKFFYNTNGSLAYYDSNIFGRYKYVYNSLGKIITKNTYDLVGNVETFRDTYSYSYSTNVVTENVTPHSSNGFIYKYTFDTSGNLITVNSFTKSSPTDVVGTASGNSTYNNYDNKKNNGGGFPSLVLFPSNSVNNVGTVVYGSNSYSYTYIYNSDDYVTKRTDDGGSITTYKYIRI